MFNFKKYFKKKSQINLNDIKRHVTKYLQNSYNGNTGYLSTIAKNFKGVKYFSMDIKATDNSNGRTVSIERVMIITKKDYYNDFGRKLVMVHYKKTDCIINKPNLGG